VQQLLDGKSIGGICLETGAKASTITRQLSSIRARLAEKGVIA
jgi:hypothetical protein